MGDRRREGQLQKPWALGRASCSPVSCAPTGGHGTCASPDVPAEGLDSVVPCSRCDNLPGRRWALAQASPRSGQLFPEGPLSAPTSRPSLPWAPVSLDTSLRRGPSHWPAEAIELPQRPWHPAQSAPLHTGVPGCWVRRRGLAPAAACPRGTPGLRRQARTPQPAWHVPQCRPPRGPCPRRLGRFLGVAGSLGCPGHLRVSARSHCDWASHGLPVGLWCPTLETRWPRAGSRCPSPTPRLCGPRPAPGAARKSRVKGHVHVKGDSGQMSPGGAGPARPAEGSRGRSLPRSPARGVGDSHACSRGAESPHGLPAAPAPACWG